MTIDKLIKLLSALPADSRAQTVYIPRVGGGCEELRGIECGGSPEIHMLVGEPEEHDRFKARGES